MENFEYDQNPSRVIFGSGSIQKLPLELERLDCHSPLILTGPNHVKEGKELMKLLEKAGIQPAGIFSKAKMHTPIEITDEAMEYIQTKVHAKVDSYISLGGGSVIGLGKSLVSRSPLPHICIVTTYSGSEMTYMVGESVNGRKTTRRDPKVLPRTVIYDVDFTLTLDVEWSCYSAMNAMAASVHILINPQVDPITTLLATEGIQSLVKALPRLSQNPNSIPIRTAIRYGTWLCSNCASTIPVSFHHKIVHTLGGSFKLPHAETHTMILPHSLAFLLPLASDKAKVRLAEILNDTEGDPVRGMNNFYKELNLRKPLKEFGMKEEQIEKGAELFYVNPYIYRREPTKAEVKEIIRRAWSGEEARADL